MIQLTDHEQRFADTAVGQRAVAHARRLFDQRHAYLGSRAPAWTPEMQAKAIRDGAAAAARASVAQTAGTSANDRALPIAQAQRETARHMAQERAHNAWKERR